MKKRTATNMIILHCSATREGQDFTVDDIRKWHKQRGFEDVGYHFIIYRDGTVVKGREESLQGAHCTGKNATSIGICYIGGCDKNMKAKDTRTEAQKQAMYKLVKDLMQKYHIPLVDVHGHYEYANKACPSFKIDVFRSEFSTWLAGDTIKKVKCPHCGKEIQLDKSILDNL